MKHVNGTLVERLQTHGDYANTAKVSNAIKTLLAGTTPIQQEALDQIAVKLARITCGDSQHKDHWEDIQGYCELVLQELEQC